MPLPKDERVVALANDLLTQFDQIFGVHSGFRAAHAKGLLLTGTFTPAAGAQNLTKAPHVVRASHAVTARFSNSTGLPQIPDNKPEANPRGLPFDSILPSTCIPTSSAIRRTDSRPATDTSFSNSCKLRLPAVLMFHRPSRSKHFSGRIRLHWAFVQTPKPFPSSFARETYFGVTAFAFTNAKGQTRFGRYRIVPEAGNDYLSDEAVARLCRPTTTSKRSWTI